MEKQGSCVFPPVRVALTWGVVLISLAAPVYAAKSKLDKALTDRLSSGTTGSVQVIITTVPGGTNVVRSKLLAKERTIKFEHPGINAISVTVDAGDLSDLAGDPAVVSVSIDAPMQSHATVLTGSDSLVTLDMLRTMIGGTSSGLTGNGVGVAIIDSGLRD